MLVGHSRGWQRPAVRFHVDRAASRLRPALGCGQIQHWVDDFSAGHIKAIGTTKIVGSVGLVLPALVGIAPVLVPLAASGLMLVMAGAAATRFRRSEWKFLAGDLVFVALLAFVAWGRFGLVPFGS